MTSAIFDNLLLTVRTRTTAQNPLIDCLKLIAKQLKISTHPWQSLSTLSCDSLDGYEQHLGIVFHPSTRQSLAAWPTSDYPVLIEEKGTGACYVFLKKSGKKPLLFNPVTAQDEYPSVATSLLIHRSWQCMPANIPPEAGYVGLLKFSLQHGKNNFIRALLLGGLASVVTLLVSVISCFILSYSLEAHTGHELVLYAAVFLFCMATAWLYYASGLFVKSVNAKLLHILLPNIVNHLLNLPLQVTRQFASSDLSQRLFDYEKSVLTVMQFTLSIFFNGTGLMILLIYMLYCSVPLAGLYLMICALLTTIKIGLFPKSIKYLTAQLLENSKLNAFLVEALLKIHTLRSANAENDTFNRWLQKLLKSKIFSERAAKMDLLISVIDIASPVMLLLCVYTVLYAQPAASTSYDLIKFMVCAGQFSAVFQKLSGEMTALIQSLPGLNRLAVLLAAAPEDSQPTAVNMDFQRQLTLSHISFQHAGNALLDDVSLTIPAGKFIAIVGHSGAGKSTLLRILLGLESASSGSIWIDDMNIENINRQNWRKQFGVVLQNSSLLPGSLFSNIASNTRMTMAEAWQLARCVGLDEEIETMPMKMFTYVSDNAGESLSGGQKQKILIARALATRPKILLLDEATSALDNHSQAHIHRHLNALGVTRVVIAHRYSTVVGADVIYVMEKGRIIDSGAYGELGRRGSLGVV